MRKYRGLLLIPLLVMAMLPVMGQEIEDEEEDREEEIEMLDRNVRIDFKMIPQEDAGKGAFIVTSTPWYRTGIAFKGNGGEIEFSVAGEVRILDGEDRIFVEYEADISFRGPDGEADFHMASGVKLRPGKAMEVARIGERTLVIEASFLEEDDPDEEEEFDD